MQETIDIVFPNYNKMPYIRECLNSLLDQTYRNWRCIVVDNFSEDGSWETIQNFAKQDNRFQLYQIPKPTTSFYRTWNFGLAKVESCYFCVLTSDDIWPKEWLATAIDSLNRQEKALCAAARTKIVDSDSKWGEPALFNLLGERFFMTASEPQMRQGLTSSIASYFLGPIYTSIHSLVMRSELLNQGEKFAEDVGSTADYEWYIRLGLHGNIIYHPQIEVGWRVYEGQATKHRNQDEYARLIEKIHLRTRDIIADKLSDTLADQFIKMAEDCDDRLLSYHYARPYLVNLRDKPLVEIPKLLKVLYTNPREVVKDILFKLQGKYFFTEESLAVAIKFYNAMNVDD